MGYRLRSGQPVAHEVVRVAHGQLALAMAALSAVDDDDDTAVHTARRRIKKVRALLRLARPALGRRRQRRLNRRLRAVNRLLAPVADGQAVLGTLTRVTARYRDDLPPDLVAAIHHRLVRRETMAVENAALENVCDTALALLRREQARIEHGRSRKTGFRAIDDGLERTVRQGRRAMARAVGSGRSDDYHTWRQRVKDRWLQTRLLQERCGNRLTSDERRLEELDGLLGECHNCALLRDAVRADSTLTRGDIARCVRVVRRYEHTLRRAARLLGAKVYHATPSQTVARIRRFWRQTGRATPVERRGTSCQAAA